MLVDRYDWRAMPYYGNHMKPIQSFITGKDFLSMAQGCKCTNGLLCLYSSFLVVYLGYESSKPSPVYPLWSTDRCTRLILLVDTNLKFAFRVDQFKYVIRRIDYARNSLIRLLWKGSLMLRCLRPALESCSSSLQWLKGSFFFCFFLVIFLYYI